MFGLVVALVSGAAAVLAAPPIDARLAATATRPTQLGVDLVDVGGNGVLVNAGGALTAWREQAGQMQRVSSGRLNETGRLAGCLPDCHGIVLSDEIQSEVLSNGSVQRLESGTLSSWRPHPEAWTRTQVVLADNAGRMVVAEETVGGIDIRYVKADHSTVVLAHVDSYTMTVRRQAESAVLRFWPSQPPLPDRPTTTELLIRLPAGGDATVQPLGAGTPACLGPDGQHVVVDDGGGVRVRDVSGAAPDITLPTGLAPEYTRAPSCALGPNGVVILELADAQKSPIVSLVKGLLPDRDWWVVWLSPAAKVLGYRKVRASKIVIKPDLSEVAFTRSGRVSVAVTTGPERVVPTNTSEDVVDLAFLADGDLVTVDRAARLTVSRP